MTAGFGNGAAVVTSLESMPVPPLQHQSRATGAPVRPAVLHRVGDKIVQAHLPCCSAVLHVAVGVVMPLISSAKHGCVIMLANSSMACTSAGPRSSPSAIMSHTYVRTSGALGWRQRASSCCMYSLQKAVSV